LYVRAYLRTYVHVHARIYMHAFLEGIYDTHCMIVLWRIHL